MDAIKDIALPTAALVIGAIAIIGAIIGNIKTEKFTVLLSKGQSRSLGIFGAILLIVGIFTYLAPLGLPNLPDGLTPTETTELIPTSIFTPTLNKISTQTPFLLTYTPEPSNEYIDEKGIAMVLVPSGEFTMGRSYGENQNEEPAHKVFLDDYYIDKFEVTNGAYADCEKEEVCLPPKDLSSPERQNYYRSSNFRNFPVIYVNWDMANTFCEWRDARLPTEAEWEKAARGEDESNKFYPWGGDTGCSFGNFAACNKDTVRVGSYPKGVSPYGVYDIAGNVWEWVADWYSFDYYEFSPYNNPKGPDVGEYRVLRGGSWNNPSNEVRVTYRVRYLPIVDSFNLGFRCARSMSQ